MRIAIDIRPLSGSQHGGVAEYLKNLLPALFEHAPDHEFHLFANSYSAKEDYFEFSKNPNTVIHKFNVPNKAFTFSCRYINRPFIDKLVGGADVFFSPHFFPAPVSPSCKKVVTFHDISFERFPEYFDLRRRIWHKYVSPRKQALSADKIISVSESTKDDLVDLYGISSGKIETIYSGICDSVTSSSGKNWASIKKKHNLPEDYILSLSTIEPRKNITSLIRAFNVLKKDPDFAELYLVVAGANGWSYKEVFNEAASSPYKNNIIFTGVIKEGEKYALYKNARAFAYPSLYEGFGFPPLEAMHAGTPTVVSMTTSLPEVTRGASVLINPFYPEDLADSLRDVLKDERLRQHLTQEGKKVAENYSWHKAAEETLKVLESSIN